MAGRDHRFECDLLDQLVPIVSALLDLMKGNRPEEQKLIERLRGVLATHNTALAAAFVDTFTAEKEAELKGQNEPERESAVIKALIAELRIRSRKRKERVAKEAATAAGARSDDQVLHCSFCGQSQYEVKKMIAGPTVFICDECILLCMDIIYEESDAGDQDD